MTLLQEINQGRCAAAPRVDGLLGIGQDQEAAILFASDAAENLLDDRVEHVELGSRRVLELVQGDVTHDSIEAIPQVPEFTVSNQSCFGQSLGDVTKRESTAMLLEFAVMLLQQFKQSQCRNQLPMPGLDDDRSGMIHEGFDHLTQLGVDVDPAEDTWAEIAAENEIIGEE